MHVSLVHANRKLHHLKTADRRRLKALARDYRLGSSFGRFL